MPLRASRNDEEGVAVIGGVTGGAGGKSKRGDGIANGDSEGSSEARKLEKGIS